MEWGTRGGGGATFSFRHPAVLLPADARSMENAKRREGSPPAEQRDLIVAELFNQIPRCFQTTQKLKPRNKNIVCLSFLILGVNYVRYLLFFGGYVKYVSNFRQWINRAGNDECVETVQQKR